MFPRRVISRSLRTQFAPKLFAKRGVGCALYSVDNAGFFNSEVKIEVKKNL